MVGKKTITQSFRLDAKIQRVIGAEAAKQRVSMNTLVNQVLDDFADYGRFTKQAKVVRFGPPIVDAIFNELSDESVMKIGMKIGETHPREMLSAISAGRFTVDNAVRLIEHYLSHHAGWYESTEIEKEPDVWTVHLRHGLRRKWSLFVCSYMKAMLQALKFHLIEITHVDDFSTTLRMEPPSK
ncbi:MAG: hypothetical protein ACE5KO_04715 [Candidatus Bathyarchaeia archaeon]